MEKYNTNENTIENSNDIIIDNENTNEIGEIDKCHLDKESIKVFDNNSEKESLIDEDLIKGDYEIERDYEMEEIEHNLDDIEYDKFNDYMNNIYDDQNINMLDEKYKNKYNNFESDYTTNYGENEDGEYENY